MIFLAFMSLFRNVRRTAAVLVTIALGTGVLFSFKGFIHGVLEDYRESTVHAHYGHGQIHTKHYRDSFYAEPWKHWIQDWDKIEEFLLKQKSVQHVFPRLSFSALLKKGNVTVSGSGQGIVPSREAAFFHLLNIEEGTALTDQAKGILLGHGLAKALELKPGDQVTLLVTATDGSLSQSELTVAGIFQTGSLDFDSRIFRIPLQEAQGLMKTKNVESLSLGLVSHEAWDEVANATVKAFPHLEGSSFAELDKVYYQHSVDWLHAQFHVVQVIILSIVLLGIFNSISSAILERKQEIGNFRANGESVLDIMRLILLEGSLVGLLGSLSGIALTYAVIMLLLNNQIEMPPGPGLTRSFLISFKFDWRMAWTSGCLSIAAALLASGLAGLRVARMSIASALRAY